MTKQPNTWIQALKIYNTGNKTYHVPKKGTPEYLEVRKIMDELKNKDIKPEAPKDELIIIDKIEEIEPPKEIKEELLKEEVIKKRVPRKKNIKKIN